MSAVAAMIEAVEEVKPRRVVSPARIAANQRNAQRSTGPMTEAGKARARANEVKHGLTGAGVAVPGEDQAPLEARFVELQAELQPTDMLGMLYVELAALISVQGQRAARHEAAALATVARHAEREFEVARLDKVDRLWRHLAVNPGPNRRRLMTTPEGIELLSSALESVRN